MGTPAGNPQRRWSLSSGWAKAALIVAAVAGLLAVCIFVLPTPLARWAVSRQLDKMGISFQGLRTLDVDLAQGEVWLGPVQFSASQREPAQLAEFGFDASLSSLWRKRVLFDRMIVRGLDIHVRRVLDGPITINGIALTQFLPKPPPAQRPDDAMQGSTGEDEGRDWGAGIDDFEFRDSRLLLTSTGGGRLLINVERMDLRGFRTWTPDKPGTFEIRGEANGIRFRLDGEARPFTDVISVDSTTKIEGVRVERIRQFTGPLLELDPHQGVLGAWFESHAKLYPDGRIEGATNGRAQVDSVQMAKLDQFDVSMPQGKLQFDLSFTVDGSDAMAVQGKTHAALQKIKARRADGSDVLADAMQVTLSDLDVATTGGGSDNPAQFTRLQGTIAVEINGADASLPGAAGGAESSPPMHVSIGSLKLDVHTQELGRASGASDDETVRLAGSAQAQGIAASVPGAVARQPVTASVDAAQIDLRNVSVSLGAGPVDWQGAFDAEVTGAFARVGDEMASIQLPHVSLQGAEAGAAPSLSADRLALENPSVRLTRRLFNALKEGSPNQPEPGAEGASEQKLPARIALDHVMLAGNGSVEFQDETVQPAIDLQAVLQKLDVRKIDTGNPGQHTGVAVAGKLGDLSEISADGWATPFAAQRNFQLAASAEGVQLHKFSGYAAQAIGMVIDRGTLQADIDATASDGQLNAVVSGVVRDFDLVKAEQGRAGSGFPVDLALALLEDKEGKIALRVPVHGNLKAPKFDLSDAVSTALSGAVRQVALGALDLVFLPETITQALFGGGETGTISRPVSFAAGSAELGPDAQQVTGRLVDLLDGRPKLAVEVCGTATARDLSALRTRRLNERALDNGTTALEFTRRHPEQVAQQARPELERLAAERGRVVRQQLLRQGVPPSRISECRPELDLGSQTQPGAVVSLQVS